MKVVEDEEEEGGEEEVEGPWEMARSRFLGMARGYHKEDAFLHWLGYS